jgi:hypothetical protein
LFGTHDQHGSRLRERLGTFARAETGQISTKAGAAAGARNLGVCGGRSDGNVQKLDRPASASCKSCVGFEQNGTQMQKWGMGTMHPAPVPGKCFPQFPPRMRLVGIGVVSLSPGGCPDCLCSVMGADLSGGSRPHPRPSPDAHALPVRPDNSTTQSSEPALSVS